MDMQTSFRSRLIAEGILFPTGIDGLWGRNGTFERVFDGLEHAITQAGLADKPEVMRFPPAMAQKTFEKSGYMKNFPHFARPLRKGGVGPFGGSPGRCRRLLLLVRGVSGCPLWAVAGGARARVRRWRVAGYRRWRRDRGGERSARGRGIASLRGRRARS